MTVVSIGRVGNLEKLYRYLSSLVAMLLLTAHKLFAGALSLIKILRGPRSPAIVVLKIGRLPGPFGCSAGGILGGLAGAVIGGGIGRSLGGSFIDAARNNEERSVFDGVEF